MQLAPLLLLEKTSATTDLLELAELAEPAELVKLAELAELLDPQNYEAAAAAKQRRSITDTTVNPAR